ncbi:MAG: hypothetical protein Unbinned200contig1000_23 [Prokaryotic dsDNA virus sp.]|jgi:hypothetical protein|nr:hypothetical protein [Flavobacteriaceae bacterium]QDP65283.1 MAG: hypothetical protein Unbinned200contig1000_23 [Prokaryotic dsDNA virus sp.]|tara:strand:+ start:31352 stop:32425 length:1074 start_codon:yes stop_codon:yes gene_type:complete
MAYSTGSGDYNALMAAVLAHAVADGWVEAGGVGTGWPISKGNVRGVDWSTFTVSDTDYTSGAGVPKTTRWLRISVGETTAAATTNASSDTTSANAPNMEYTFDAWHIFSDPSIGDHINVVVQFSNGIDAQVFGHFSFGEVNKYGMSHGGVAYASGHPVRGFSPNTSSGQNSNDANAGAYARINRIFSGRLGFSANRFETYNPIVFMTPSTNNPFPSLSVWPSPDTLYDYNRIIDVLKNSSSSIIPSSEDFSEINMGVSFQVMMAQSQLYSGGVSLMPIPMFVANGDTASSSLRFINVGSFPNVRSCSLENLLPGDEITYSGDTWKVFPLLCRKNKSTLGVQYQVTSGLYGLAYKKVI